MKLRQTQKCNFHVENIHLLSTRTKTNQVRLSEVENQVSVNYVNSYTNPNRTNNNKDIKGRQKVQREEGKDETIKRQRRHCLLSVWLLNTLTPRVNKRQTPTVRPETRISEERVRKVHRGGRYHLLLEDCETQRD